MEVPNSVLLRVKFVMLAKIVSMVKTNPRNVVSIFLLLKLCLFVISFLFHVGFGT